MLEIYDVPDAIKKAKLFFVDNHGTLMVKYKKIEPSGVDTRHMFDERKDNIYIFNTKEDCGAYCIVNAYTNNYEKAEQNFFIFLIDDNSKFEKTREEIDKIITEISRQARMLFYNEYEILESPELCKMIDQWYDLAKHDYSRRRFITV
jgi:hypothetical protein